jgi:hypothetical protein
MSVKKSVIKSSKVVGKKPDLKLKSKNVASHPKIKMSPPVKKKEVVTSLQPSERIQTAEGWKRAMFKNKATGIK